MPKILHVTTVTHTLHFLIGQISYMQSAGFKVETASSVDPAGDEKLAFFLQHEDVPHTAIEISRALTPLRDLVSVWKLWRHLRKIRPEIVHAHTPKAGLIAMLASLLAGVPIRVYHIHGLRFSTLKGWKRWLVIACEKGTCRMATRILCVSQSAREEAARCRLARRDRIKVLRSGSINGLDATGRFDPNRVDEHATQQLRQSLGIDKSDVVIGFIGRLVRDKGIEELVAAFQELRQQLSAQEKQIHLLLVGDFESQDPVNQRTRSAIEQHAAIHRLAYDPETPKLYAAMDIFCLPSYREGLPYVSLEAAAMRLPVITTDATGCVDGVEDGVTGTCVSVGNREALAAAMRRYVEDRGLRLWHGNAGRRRILQEFAPTDIWEALFAEYVEALEMVNLATPNRSRARPVSKAA